MTVAVGIDLGTTNTVVGAVRGGQPTTLADEFGRRLLPSIVSFHPMGQVLVGDPAKERRLNDPKNTVYSVKRLLGRRWSSPEVQRLRSQIPFELVEGIRESVSVMARGETYALPEISAFVLRRARDFAMAAVGDEVNSAVITVPANFNDLQRASTKVAGQLADLEVLRIMNEPTAAALAYGQQLQGAQRIAVYDFGGGTFDLSLLDLSKDVYEVLMTKGDTALGGDDIDTAIAERMAHHVMRTLNVSTDAPEIKGRLRLFAEDVKIALSEKTETEILLTGIGHGPGGKELEAPFKMTRAEIEHLAAPFIERTMLICRQAMAAANIPVQSFDAVVLVGGSTRMPAVASRVAEIFKKQPHADVNPEEVVALGAAIQAQNLSRAVRKTGPKPPLPAAATKPAAPALQQPVTDPQAFPALPHAPPTFPESVPPPPVALAKKPAPPPLPTQTQTMQVQTMPAPIQPMRAPMPAIETAVPAMLPVSVPPPMPGPLLIDVTPLSLGVETAGGYNDAILAAGTAVPCDKTRLFVTAADRQTNVVVRVAQGESRMFAENTYLGECLLQNLRSAPRGEVKIAVTFEIDANGMLVVRAKDAETGQETKATIRAFGAQVDPQEVAAMQQRMAGRRIG